MENPNYVRGHAVLGKPVRDPYLYGREATQYLYRWLSYYFADLGAEGFAAVLEEVAAGLSAKAEVLRSR